MRCKIELGARAEFARLVLMEVELETHAVLARLIIQ